MTQAVRKSVLFVCMGNICRSPTAEGVFRQKLQEAGLATVVRTDSAGTHGYHIGSPPDPRACKAALGRGIDISDLRARLLVTEDFQNFDYVVAMDNDNLSVMRALRPAQSRAHIGLLLDYAPPGSVREVPDPYYGSRQGFDQVLDLVEAGCQGLLQEILQQAPRGAP
jgi:protein-tyrosine phosphatase